MRVAIVLIDFQKEFFEKNGILKQNAIDQSIAANAFQFTNDMCDVLETAPLIVVVQSCYDNWKNEKAPPRHLNKCNQSTTTTIRKSERLAGSHFGGNCCVADSALHPLLPCVAQLRETRETVLIEKTYYSAFIDTNLQELLQKESVNRIYVTGVTSTSCVQATSIDCSLLGYDTVLVSDCSAATSLASHCKAAFELEQQGVWRARCSNEIIAFTRDFNGQERPFRFIPNILSSALASDVFQSMKSEVAWQEMFHGGKPVSRLVSTQCQPTSEGHIPIYRFPSDEEFISTEWSPIVKKVREELQAKLGHFLNHAKAQLYADRNRSHIGMHSDKTLDITLGSYIVNLSLGAQRVMHIHSKTTDETFEIEMPHNCAIVFNTVANALYQHGVPADKRNPSFYSNEDCIENGERISIVFRTIGTFRVPGSACLYGQGARYKTVRDLQNAEKSENTSNTPLNDQKEILSLIQAFSHENKQANDFDWNKEYGKGFDCIALNLNKNDS